MDLKKQIGLALQQQIDARLNAKEIGQWALNFYCDHYNEMDRETRHVMKDIFTMKEGPQFEYTPEELSFVATLMINNEKAPREKLIALVLKKEIGFGLQQQIDAGLNAYQIGKWASHISPDDCRLLDSETRDILIDLYTMEEGTEFEYSSEELSYLASLMINNIKDPRKKLRDLITNKRI